VQSKNFGFNPTVVGSSAFPKLINIAGEASEGYYGISAFDPNDKRPRQANFIKNFINVYKNKPGEGAGHAYDIVYMVKKAIEMGGTTREKLIKILHQSDFEYDGVTGLIKFDEYGDVSGKRSILLKVKDGEFLTVDTKF